MMKFEFATASRIVFGFGVSEGVGQLAAEWGQHAFIATGLPAERLEPLLESLNKAAVSSTILRVEREPTLDFVQQGLELARRQGCDMVIGIGGGSAIDTAKAIAALLANPGDPLDYLEVIGKAQPLKRPSLPCLAIPTTAGTGAEVTRNSVLSVPEKRLKVSLRSPFMLPKVALVDPQWCLSLPPTVTAYTGLDALTQLIEPFVCNQPNPITDALAREGLRHAAWALRRAYYDGQDHEARQAMSLASLLSGLALANARLGAVHGFAAVLGGRYEAHHGALCARLLPIVCEVNLRALVQRAPQNPALPRYHEIARLLTGHPQADAWLGIQWLEELVRELQVPSLATYGVLEADIPEICAQAAQASSMKGNPLPLTTEEMEEILLRAL